MSIICVQRYDFNRTYTYISHRIILPILVYMPTGERGHHSQ